MGIIKQMELEWMDKYGAADESLNIISECDPELENYRRWNDDITDADADNLLRIYLKWEDNDRDITKLDTEELEALNVANSTLFNIMRFEDEMAKDD